MPSFFDRITGEKQRVSLTIQDDPTQVIEFDATVSETHIGNSQTSDHPVEAGADLTDHIQRVPEELQLTAIVSDTPILFLASLRAEPSIPGGDPRNRAQDAYGFLKGIKDAGQLVSISTTLRDYSNMAIVGFSVVRDSQKARILEANLSLREILIATTEQVEPPVVENSARKARTNQGKKTKTPTAEPAQPRSVLARAFSFIGG